MHILIYLLYLVHFFYYLFQEHKDTNIFQNMVDLLEMFNK